MALCDSWIKVVLLFFTFLIALLGLSLTALDAAYFHKFESFTDILSSDITLAPIIFLVLGSVTVITAFGGCCGVLKESNCLLSTFAISLGLVFVAEVIVAIYVFVDPKRTYDTFYKMLSGKFYETGSDQSAFAMVSSLQQNLKCCGVNGPLDYSAETNTGSATWPPTLALSCCPETVKLCTDNDYYLSGCADVLSEFVRENVTVLACVAIGLGFIEVAAVVCALIETRYLAKKY